MKLYSLIFLVFFTTIASALLNSKLVAKEGDKYCGQLTNMLPSCYCSNGPMNNALIKCPVTIRNDTLNFEMDLSPCTTPLTPSKLSVSVTDQNTVGVRYFTNISADGESRLEWPFLGTNASNAVTVLNAVIYGDISSLSVVVAIDVCTNSPGVKRTCGLLNFLRLPTYVIANINNPWSFDDICPEKNTTTKLSNATV